MTIRTIERTAEGYAIDGNLIHYVGSYPKHETPDVLVARDREGLLEALYGTYQCNDAWKEWDEFHIDGKPAFMCYSVHVIDIGNPADLLERCAQSRTRMSADWDARAVEAAAGRSHLTLEYIADRKTKELAGIDRLVARLREIT